MADKVCGLLGLMRRASAVQIGEDRATAAVQAGGAKLLLLASDVSENAARHAENVCNGRRTLLLKLHLDRYVIGEALGMGSCSMAAVTDLGFADALLKELNKERPELYAEAADTVRQRQEKARRRKRETAVGKQGNGNVKRRTGA